MLLDKQTVLVPHKLQIHHKRSRRYVLVKAKLNVSWERLEGLVNVGSREKGRRGWGESRDAPTAQSSDYRTHFSTQTSSPASNPHSDSTPYSLDALLQLMID